MQEKKCVVDNHIFSYIESKDKDKSKTLVFLHGWMQNKESFQSILEQLEKQWFSFVSLDFPWFWKNPLLSDTMTIEDYWDSVVAFMEKLKLEKPILVGHSFWGRVSIYLWSFYENIDKIILIGSAGIAPHMNAIRLSVIKVGKIFFSIPGLKKIWKIVKNKISWEDYKNAWKMTEIYKNTISNDLQKYMIKNNYPICMIWWKNDDQVTQQETQLMHEKLRKSKLHIIEGGHFVHQESPQEVLDIILPFIK